MSTSLDLTPYVAVQQATFVKMSVPSGNVTVDVRASTYSGNVAIEESPGQSFYYTAVGQLMGVSEITSDLKTSSGDVSVTFTGIPSSNIPEFLNNPIKGSPIEIRRAFFNPITGNILSTPGNPVLEFKGVINNFSVEEGWTEGFSKDVTSTITLSCSSLMSVLSRKVTGRRTNRDDQNYWFPGDKAFDRVAVISEAVFDFGADKPVITTQTSSSTQTTNLQHVAE